MAERPPGEADGRGTGRGETRRLAGFEILGHIGRGGMGIVLKARQVSMDRVVALKILPRHLADDIVFVERFFREARSAARLRHPHIVQAYDAGESDGTCYFAMEFVDGEGLGTVLAREGALDPQQALVYMRQVCSALAAAHKAGIVHRDIKPSNILIDGEGQVRVADFGLAHHVEEEADGSRRLGTPGYAAPEQIRAGEGGPRSDLYSLGATFFRVLAGRAPFPGKDSREMLRRQASGPAPSLAEVAPHLDRRLARIIDRLLAADPADRYPSAQAVLDELEALGSARPRLAAAPRRLPRRRSRAPGRSVAGTVAVLAVIGLLAAGAVVVLTQRGGARSSSRPRQTPQAAFDAADAYRKAHPEDIDGALAHFRDVQARFPGTPWAERSADAIERIERQQRDAAARAAAREEADQTLAELRRECDAFAGRDSFGDALARFEAFKKAHPVAAREATALASQILDKARGRYSALARDADAAIRRKDFAQARQAIRPALFFGVPAIAEQARAKIDEIEAREKQAELWEKWDAVRARSDELAKQGKWDDAIRALDAAKGLPLAKIDEHIARQTRAVHAARRKAIGKRIAAYEEQADRIWSLFRQRQYGEARTLIDEARRNADFEPAADRMAADAEAARLLALFWAHVEGGATALIDHQLAIDGPVGTVQGIEDGVITIVVNGVEFQRHMHRLSTKQALGIAKLGDEPNDKLLVAAFLMAEGKDLTRAQRLLADAGRSPGAKALRARFDRLVERLAVMPAGRGDGAWQQLFDGKTLTGWRIVRDLPEGKAGRVGVGQGVIGLWEDGRAAGVAWDGPFPTQDYEVVVEAQRVRGDGRFCNIIFPAWDGHGLFAVGDRMVGLGLVNGKGAHENLTTRRARFRNGRWYTIRLRVTAHRVRAWVDDEVVDLPKGRGRLTLSHVFTPFRPFGLASERARAAFRSVRLRRLPP